MCGISSPILDLQVAAAPAEMEEMIRIVKQWERLVQSEILAVVPTSVLMENAGYVHLGRYMLTALVKIKQPLARAERITLLQISVKQLPFAHLIQKV